MNTHTRREAGAVDFSRLARRALAVALVALAGCSGGTSSGMTETGKGTKPASGNSMLALVRASGQVGNELDVQPLRDPQVEDLRAAATRSEDRGDFAGARRAIAQALQLSPNDPDLLQWQGELSLVARDWPEAEQFATRSFEKGPKLGGLCRRNWTTIQLAAQASGNATRATQAQQRIAGCIVAPPTRM